MPSLIARLRSLLFPAETASPTMHALPAQDPRDRRVGLTAEGCLRAGTTTEERIAFAIRMLTDWRHDSAAWITLNREHELHDGVFDEARFAFEAIPHHLREQLESATGQVSSLALSEAAEAARKPFRYASSPVAEAARRSRDTLQSVLSGCEADADPEETLRCLRSLSPMRLARESRSAP